MRRDVFAILFWVGFLALGAATVCVYVDRRATQTELYVTRVVVDAAQGFPAWRDYVKQHPEETQRWCR